MKNNPKIMECRGCGEEIIFNKKTKLCRKCRLAKEEKGKGKLRRPVLGYK